MASSVASIYGSSGSSLTDSCQNRLFKNENCSEKRGFVVTFAVRSSDTYFLMVCVSTYVGPWNMG